MFQTPREENRKRVFPHTPITTTFKDHGRRFTVSRSLPSPLSAYSFYKITYRSLAFRTLLHPRRTTCSHRRVSLLLLSLPTILFFPVSLAFPLRLPSSTLTLRKPQRAFRPLAHPGLLFERVAHDDAQWGRSKRRIVGSSTQSTRGWGGDVWLLEQAKERLRHSIVSQYWVRSARGNIVVFGRSEGVWHPVYSLVNVALVLGDIFGTLVHRRRNWFCGCKPRNASWCALRRR